MTTNEIVNAMIPAHLLITFGKPFASEAEKFAAGKALVAMKTFSVPERIAIMAEIKKAAKLCAAA